MTTQYTLMSRLHRMREGKVKEELSAQVREIANKAKADLMDVIANTMQVEDFTSSLIANINSLGDAPVSKEDQAILDVLSDLSSDIFKVVALENAINAIDLALAGKAPEGTDTESGEVSAAVGVTPGLDSPDKVESFDEALGHTVASIAAHNKDIGKYYFSPDTLKFFGQKKGDFKVKHVKSGEHKGIYVHAPMNREGSVIGHSVGKYNPATGEVIPVHSQEVKDAILGSK